MQAELDLLERGNNHYQYHVYSPPRPSLLDFSCAIALSFYRLFLS